MEHPGLAAAALKIKNEATIKQIPQAQVVEVDPIEQAIHAIAYDFRADLLKAKRLLEQHGFTVERK